MGAIVIHSIRDIGTGGTPNCAILAHLSLKLCHFGTPEPKTVPFWRKRRPSSPLARPSVPWEIATNSDSFVSRAEGCPPRKFLRIKSLRLGYLDFGLPGSIRPPPARRGVTHPPDTPTPSPGSLPPLTGSHTGGYVRNFSRILSEKVCSFCDKDPGPAFSRKLVAGRLRGF